MMTPLLMIRETPGELGWLAGSTLETSAASRLTVDPPGALIPYVAAQGLNKKVAPVSVQHVVGHPASTHPLYPLYPVKVAALVQWSRTNAANVKTGPPHLSDLHPLRALVNILD